LSLRLEAFLCSLSFVNLDVGVECQQNIVVPIVWPPEVPLWSERSVTGSLYWQGIFHIGLRLEFLCARLAVLILNQEYIATNNTCMSVTIVRLFFFTVSSYFYKSFHMFCLFVWLRYGLFSVICNILDIFEKIYFSVTL
jgi:hypothetical protein